MTREEIKDLYGDIQIPEKIPLRPSMTESKRFTMPAIRFWMTAIGFCIGMVVVNAVAVLGNSASVSDAVKFAVEILAGAAGYFLASKVLEPRWYIPFDSATDEQQRAELERLSSMEELQVAEMKRRYGDRYEQKIKELEEQEAKEAAKSTGVDRAIFEDDEPVEEVVFDDEEEEE